MILGCWLIFLLGASTTESSAITRSPIYGTNLKNAVNGHYIIVLKENISQAEVSHHNEYLSQMLTHFNNSAINGHFHIGSFRGYTAKLEDKALYHITLLKEVQYIEVDQYVNSAGCTEQSDATWGIVRTATENPSSSSSYYYNSDCAGNGVNIYVIDTGIEVSHSDFNGRAKWGSDFIDSSGNSQETDLNGHGTHCAGTIISDTWGLAKKATAIAVRVLDENGSGYISGVISGISWVVNHHQSSGKKSVANLSLGGGYSNALNNAVDAAVNYGVHMIVAAGNELGDACYYSPASNQNGITVAASDNADDFAYFSNYGTCVDIIAPGVYITSTWLNNGVATLSGTSMAAPHVAGVVAKILSCNDLSPSYMKSYLQKIGSLNKIQEIPSDTPNILVYKSCDD